MAGKITSTAPVVVQDGAKASEIDAAGVSVAKGVTVTGDIKSTSESKLEIKGDVTGSVSAPDSKNVEIGEEAKITGNLNTHEDAEVVLPPTADIGNVGGIIGWLMSDNTTAIYVKDCVNKANISKIGSVRGIIGTVTFTSTQTKVSNCKNTGNLEGSRSSVQGIIGVQSGVTIITENNTNSGTITENDLDKLDKK